MPEPAQQYYEAAVKAEKERDALQEKRWKDKCDSERQIDEAWDAVAIEEQVRHHEFGLK